MSEIKSPATIIDKYSPQSSSTVFSSLSILIFLAAAVDEDGQYQVSLSVHCVCCQLMIILVHTQITTDHCSPGHVSVSQVSAANINIIITTKIFHNSLSPALTVLFTRVLISSVMACMDEYSQRELFSHNDLIFLCIKLFTLDKGLTEAISGIFPHV